MCWDVELDHGIMLATCHGIVVKNGASLWDAGPIAFKFYMDQARELFALAQEFETALYHPGNGHKSPQDVLDEIATLTNNELAPRLLQVFSDSYAREQRRNHAKQRTEPTSQTRNGHVYLLEGGGYYKIGLSSDPDRRTEEISPRLPFETQLICTIATDDMDSLEAELHERFADKRVNGEWFELESEDIEFIMQLTQDKEIAGV